MTIICPDYIAPALHALAVPIDQVSLDSANARRHDPANVQIIKSSLEGYGQQKPIVIDAGGKCLAGNGTLMAAKALGWAHIAATRSDLTGIKARAYSIADNRATDTSHWHEKLLAEQLAALQNDQTVNHLLTGFDDQEIDEVIGRAVGIDQPMPADKVLPPEVSIDDTYQVLVACNDEGDQRHLYERLAADGYSCRLLTL